MACEQIKATLAPYTAAGKSWQDAVTQANVDGKPLIASSWYKQPLTQNANKYATQGVAISEVTVDVLTGEVRVERTDILMDLGNQLDAAVDIGQLQGGFMIALGYVLSEEVRYDKNGVLLNLGTWEYKIPSAYDIPIELNVSLLKDSPNPAGIKGSKASAEPAMALVSSVYLAVKNAIYASRSSNGLGEDWFMLNLPVTPQAIRAAVGTTCSSMVIPGGA